MNKLQLRVTLPFVLVASSMVEAADNALPANQNYLKVLLVTVFVVGLIFACAWLVRRMSGGVGFNQKHMQVMSVLPLGAREKLMIIRAANEYLLIGVTANSIQTLHRFDEPIERNEITATSPFADKLKGLLKGFDGDPLAKHRSASQGSEKH